MTVLVPAIDFVHFETDSAILVDPADAAELAAFVVDVACEALDRPTLVCAAAGEGLAAGRGDDLDRFVSLSSDIVGAETVTGWSDLLAALAAGDSTRCVIVHHLRARVPEGSIFQPVSSAVAHAKLSTHLRTAVVECGSGRVLRKSEVFVRQSPDPNQRTFVEALRSAYERIR